MNKRGTTISYEELIKTIISVLLVLLLLWAGVKIWNATHPEKYSVEKKDLKRIVSEIKDLKSGDAVTVPLFSTKNYSIEIIRTVDNKAGECYMDYCVCYVKEPVRLCESFSLDKDFGGDFKKVTFSPTTIPAKGSVTLKREDSRIAIFAP